MTHIVPRTCTVVGEDDSRDGQESSSRPLEDFREIAACVLLGAPGAGKTEAFQREAKCSGGCYVTVRNFTTFDNKPEWHGAMLFIDGLDEMRAGSTDERTPLDNIRTKLDRLGRPRFRLSCREADWFGANDRDHLQAVSRDGKVTVLRLNPLSGNDIRVILRVNFSIGDADEFVAAARARGIDTLLTNPQSLKMLAEAVKGGIWPHSRLQTFDLACKTLLSEFNRDHLIANQDRFAIPHLKDAAGRLCALQLLTGGAGYTLPGGESDREYPGLETIPDENREILRQVLATRVFEWVSEFRASPVHRQIAEFLGSRYLAGLIDEGLPAGRVMALMTGHDGGVVSELRGLSAWLAAHSKLIRTEVIERDPIGTILYGDVRGFSSDEKSLLLECLEREAKRNPAFVRAIQMDSRLGDLITSDMEGRFRKILADSARDDARQSLVLILMESLEHGPAIPGLADLMMEVLRDSAWWYVIKHRAVSAFIRNSADSGDAFAELKMLIADVYDGRVLDPDDNLLGCLLTHLYPEALSTQEILEYLRVSKKPDTCPRYEYFWIGPLSKKSTPAQLAQLLDDLVVRYGQLSAEIKKYQPGSYLFFLRKLPIVLLRRFLETSHNEVDTKRLFDWMGFAADSEFMSSGADAEFFRSWLNCHPTILKEIIKLGVEDCAGSGDFQHRMYRVERRLFGAKPPDFGHWCLDQAVAATNYETARYFLVEALNAEYGGNQPRHFVEKRITGHADLEGMYQKLQEERAERERLLESHEYAGEEHEVQKNQRQGERHDQFKRHEAALRENRVPRAVLHTLAQVYFGGFVDISGTSPMDRLQNLVGHDEILIRAILDGLRGAIRRDDLPTDAQIISLGVQERTHYLALPILASLEEATAVGSNRDISLDEKQMRLALAIHYTVGTPQPPSWLPPLLRAYPEVVSDVLIRVGRSKLRNGADYFSGLHDLVQSDNYAIVARSALLPLLKAFPVRCRRRQLQGLSSLLQAALLRCEETLFLELIGEKLDHSSMNVAQRVYWLAIGVLASPESYIERLESYVAGVERRIRCLAEVVASLQQTLAQRLDVPALQLLVQQLGSSFRPYVLEHSAEDRTTSQAMAASDHIHNFIYELAATPSRAATEALKALSLDDDLHPWRSYLLDAAYHQKATRRDVGFRYCDFTQVLETLDKKRPANAPDLAALTIDLLDEISRKIHDGDTSDWRQYWNAESPHQARDPRPEEWCRDALLSDLKNRLNQLDIEARAEVRYADGKRSDISVFCNGFNVPIEIKKSCSPNLWSAIKTQLIDQYTRDPHADGYGIYFVFWFGNTELCRPTPGPGSPPKSAAELKSDLYGTLSTAEQLKISICVIDVSKPES